MSGRQRIQPHSCAPHRLTQLQVRKFGSGYKQALLDAMLPCIPVGAFDDGLLPRPVADADLTVLIPVDLDHPVFDAGGPGTLQLLWKGTEYGTPYQIEDADLAKDFIELIIPQTELQAEGFFPLNYQGCTFPGNVCYPGDPAWTLEVDRTPPGGEDIAPLIFTRDVIRDGVTPSKFDLNDNLPSRAAHWRELKSGDKLHPFLVNGTTRVAVDPIQVGNVPPGVPVPIPIPRAKIEEVGDGSVDFTFSLEDRAGNMSTESPPVTLQVLLHSVPERWPAPRVPRAETPNNFIGEQAARTPVGVVIPHDGHFQVGDIVIVQWGSQTATGERVTNPDADPIMTVQLPYSLVQAAGNGTLPVLYRVIRDGLDIGRSEPDFIVNVDLTLPGGPDPDPDNPQHGNLLAAKVIAASGEEDFISPDDLKLDATVVIPHRALDNTLVFESGDIVTIAWGTRLLPPYALRPGELNRDLELTLASQIMQDEGSGRFDLKYSITRALTTPPGKSNTALAPAKPVEVVSWNELPGGENLDTGSFPEANANNAINSEAAASGGGTPFRISSYLNMAVGDEIQYRFVAFDSYRADAVEVPASEETGSRIVSSDDVARGYYEFLVPSAKLYLAGRPGGSQAGRGRATAAYSIRNDYGTNNGATVNVLIDARPLQ